MSRIKIRNFDLREATPHNEPRTFNVVVEFELIFSKAELMAASDYVIEFSIGVHEGGLRIMKTRAGEMHLRVSKDDYKSSLEFGCLIDDKGYLHLLRAHVCENIDAGKLVVNPQLGKQDEMFVTAEMYRPVNHLLLGSTESAVMKFF